MQLYKASKTTVESKIATLLSSSTPTVPLYIAEDDQGRHAGRQKIWGLIGCRSGGAGYSMRRHCEIALSKF